MFPPDISWREALNIVAKRIDDAIAADDFHDPSYDTGTPWPHHTPDFKTPTVDYLREAVVQYPKSGGKRMRAAICLWSCGLLGGDPEKALNAAVAVELYHNWTLVHDDLIDRDDTRRGEPSVHAGTTEKMRARGKSEADAKMLGETTAILAGDWLQAWAFSKICELTESGVSAECTLNLAVNMQHILGRLLIEGEALDVELSTRPWETISTTEVSYMISGKTCALLGFAATCGTEIALDSGGAKSDDHRLYGAAQFIGNAFQLRDDWLGLYGGAAELGKPIGSDLIAKKPTMYFAVAFQRLNDAGRAELLSLAGNPDITPEQLARARQLVTNCGAEERVTQLAEDYIRLAKKELMEFPESPYRQWLMELADYAITRTR